MQAPDLPNDESQRLQALYDLHLLDTAAEERFDRLTRLAKQMFGVPIALVSLVDEQRQWFKSRQGLDACETGRDISFCGHAILGQDIYEIGDASKDPRFADNPLVTGDPRIRFYAGAPLKTASGYQIGTLCIIDDKARTLSEEEHRALRDLADCVEHEFNLMIEHHLRTMLNNSEAHNAAILRELPDIVFVVDRNGIFLESNEHPDLLVPRSELLGKHISDILPNSLAEPCQEVIAQVLSQGKAQRFDYCLSLPTGESSFEARIQKLDEQQALLVIRNTTQETATKAALERSQRMTEVIARAQSDFIREKDRRKAFDGLLADMLELTSSEYGFIGEVLRTADGAPYLKTYAITNIAWNDDTRAFYDTHAPKGMEFFNLKSLFGTALSSGKPVIANDPYHDPRRGGLPEGHPAMNAFLGIPIHHGGDLVAMLGIANRPGGYDQALLDFLQPLLVTIGQLTDAARTQRQHRANQRELARLSQVASQTTNGVIITDVDGLVEWVNEGFTRITGYTLNDVKGQKPGVFLQGEQTNPATVSEIRNALARAEGFEAELINYTKDGNPYWIRIQCNPLRDDQGTLQGFIAIESDITDTKQVTASVQASEARLRGLFELSPIGIALNDYETGAFIDLNQALLQPNGYSREEFTALSYWDLTPQEYEPQEAQQLDSMNKTGRYGPYEKEYIRKDGSRYPVLLNGMVVHDNSGRKLIWSIIEDISERKRIERMKNEFISTVSHELRTPLTSISGALGLMAGGALGEFPEQARQMIDIAHKNSKRLCFLINDLLDMEKLLAGKMRFEMHLQPLQALLEQSIQDNRAYADQFQVHLRLSHGAGGALVKVDAQRLQQVMANLLSNAAKFSPRGSEVVVSAASEKGLVRVSVRDRGPGIPIEFHEHIFQKFSQADASDTRQKGGSGLGLAITRELMERMGGVLGFDSVPGKGATFWFELPSLDYQVAESADA